MVTQPPTLLSHCPLELQTAPAALCPSVHSSREVQLTIGFDPDGGLQALSNAHAELQLGVKTRSSGGKEAAEQLGPLNCPTCKTSTFPKAISGSIVMLARSAPNSSMGPMDWAPTTQCSGTRLLPSTCSSQAASGDSHALQPSSIGQMDWTLVCLPPHSAESLACCAAPPATAASPGPCNCSP